MQSRCGVTTNHLIVSLLACQVRFLRARARAVIKRLAGQWPVRMNGRTWKPEGEEEAGKGRGLSHFAEGPRWIVRVSGPEATCRRRTERVLFHLSVVRSL